MNGARILWTALRLRPVRTRNLTVKPFCFTFFLFIFTNFFVFSGLFWKLDATRLNVLGLEAKSLLGENPGDRHGTRQPNISSSSSSMDTDVATTNTVLLFKIHLNLSKTRKKCKKKQEVEFGKRPLTTLLSSSSKMLRA